VLALFLASVVNSTVRAPPWRLLALLLRSQFHSVSAAGPQSSSGERFRKQSCEEKQGPEQGARAHVSRRLPVSLCLQRLQSWNKQRVPALFIFYCWRWRPQLLKRWTVAAGVVRVVVPRFWGKSELSDTGQLRSRNQKLLHIRLLNQRGSRQSVACAACAQKERKRVRALRRAVFNMHPVRAVSLADVVKAGPLAAALLLTFILVASRPTCAEPAAADAHGQSRSLVSACLAESAPSFCRGAAR
jgi:hypothetical protein